MSVQDYEALMAQQGGACAICRKEPVGRLCVDHCHATGKVRGLLCATCNMGLGFYRDDEGLMRAAAAYLKSASVTSRVRKLD